MMKNIWTYIFFTLTTLSGLYAQSGREIGIKVTNFEKGLPSDLDSNAILLNKLDFMAEAFEYETDKRIMERHWAKCLEALKEYPFKYFVVESDALGSEANEAKYQIRFYPEFTNKTNVPLDRILTLKERTSDKHYGLRQQRDNGNSKADYTYYEIKYFVNEAKKVYKNSFAEKN